MNYSELTTAMQDYLENDETTFVASIPTFVKQAENKILFDIRRARLPMFRQTADGNLVSGNKFLSTPNDYLAPYALAIKNGDDYQALQARDASFIREAYPDTTATGVPKEYGVFDHNTLVVGPTPNANFDVRLDYMYRPTSIVTGGTSWLGDNAEALLLNACLLEGYRFMKGEQDMLAEFKEGYATAFQAMQDYAAMNAYGDEYQFGSVRG